MSEFKKPQRLLLGGLWENHTRDGVTWFTGNLNNLRVSIWPVRERKTEKHPTHYIYIEEKQGQEAKPAPQTMTEDDLPF